MGFGREKAKTFLLGMLAALAMVFLMGAIGMEKETGHYAVAGAGGDKSGAFIILDTTTGEYQIINPREGEKGRFF